MFFCGFLKLKLCDFQLPIDRAVTVPYKFKILSLSVTRKSVLYKVVKLLDCLCSEKQHANSSI